MLDWSAQRPCKDDHGFLASLEGFGLSARDWDLLAPQVETVLCGGALPILESTFPVGPVGTRVVQVMPDGMPSFLVAFTIAASNTSDEHILYLRGARLS